MKKHHPMLNILSDNFITVRPDNDVKEAMNIVILDSKDETMIDNIYVVDKKNKLLGVVALKDLIIARSPTMMSQIMRKEIHSLKEDSSIDEAIDMIQKYDLEMIPILDYFGHLRGIFTAEDALDFLKETSLETYRNLASTKETKENPKAIDKVKSRLPWLLILLFLALFTSSILSSFEVTISSVIVLTYFQTMILDTSGNISTQALASTVINISMNPNLNYKKQLFKEVSIGLINSIITATLGFIVAYLFLSILSHDQSYQISMTVGLTLLLSLLIGTLTGSIIPIIFKKLNIDPSVASGPFMTTINDVFSLLIYLSLATYLLL
ncbi:MAG: magnesium transporter [Acholeplasmataceae bacterium]|nr:magnesium transporter [Acholeplasmataceae bacterium]MDD4468529.1 magnesium transporter [Acholeplasmataceae bacterium]MDD4824141.1 magnesium transporter [Acholeplasmataceae bacterium]